MTPPLAQLPCYLWPSSTAYHLQDLRLTAFLEHARNVVHGGLDHNQMSRKIHLKADMLQAYLHRDCCPQIVAILNSSGLLG